ncbi:MAG: transglycosylase SLT domain-containing protein [Fervidobacterium sp.]
MENLRNYFTFKRQIVSLFLLIITVSVSLSQVPQWFSEQVKKRRAGSKEPTTQEFLEDLWNTIYTISNKYAIDPVFISAVIAVESNFRNVKGPGGVLGMMQILPSTAKGIAKLLKLETPKDWNDLLNDYELNITYGTAYLYYLYKKTGSLQKALEEYNNGKNKVTYAQTVMKQYEYYKNLHEKELKELSQTSQKSESITTTYVTPESTSVELTSTTATETTNEGTQTHLPAAPEVPPCNPLIGATETSIATGTRK